jgi:STE24 endopeptidase
MNLIIVGIILTVAMFRLILELLNYRNRNQPLPKVVKNIFDEESYQKSLAYTMAKARYRFVSAIVQTLLIVLLLLIGFFPWLDSIVVSSSENSTIQTLLFMFGFYLVYFFLGIPFGYYYDFVLETKFGFNKKTKKLFVVDLFKSLLITIIIGGIALSLVNLIYSLLINSLPIFILSIFITIVLFMVGAFLTQGWFVRRFNKLTPLQDGSLKTKIQVLAERYRFKINRIFIMDSSKRDTHLNAFFTGLGKTREIVLFDTMLKKMSEDEILAVLAHELGHAFHKDAPKLLLRNLIIVALYAFTLGLLLTNPIFFTSFGFESVHLGFALVLFMQIIEPIDIVFGIFMNALSSSMEYKADAFSAKNTSSKAMAKALITLTQESFINLVPHPFYVFVNFSHPTIGDRLLALENIKISV